MATAPPLNNQVCYGTGVSARGVRGSYLVTVCQWLCRTEYKGKLTTVFAVAWLERRSRLMPRAGSTSYVNWNVVTWAMIQNKWQGDWSAASAFSRLKSFLATQSFPASRLKKRSSRDLVSWFQMKWRRPIRQPPYLLANVSKRIGLADCISSPHRLQIQSDFFPFC